MGLNKGQRYLLSVDSAVVERTLPQEKQIVISDEDMKNLVIVAVGRQSHTGISGSIFF